jgi:cell division protein FtsL
MKKINFIILVIVLYTAFAVVDNTNEFHKYHKEMQSLEKIHKEHKQRWTQLILEKSSLQNPSRVKKIAIERLGMEFIKYDE